MTTPTIIRSKPGIKKDGTRFEGDYYTDGQWCRFQRGLPRKIAGYRAATSHLNEKVYGMGSFSANMSNYIALGEASFLQQAVIDANTGNLSALVDRTPVGFSASPNNVWQFSNLPDLVASQTDLIAHAAPNLADIANQTETPVYYGQADAAGSLAVASGLDPQSGGAAAIGPYLFGYGNSGFLQWCAVNDPTTFEGEARVTGQKIVRGLPLRGGGSGPSGLFWSLDALVRATFQGTPVAFAFDELATDLSILSSRAIIEYDGVYYWWNVDRYMMFNGVVREVPNQMNVNFFLDNLNFAQRQKVFSYKVPRFGEIWTCFPFGNATECNHAIILNVREGFWFDTPLPDGGRTSGIYAQVYPKPFMTDADESPTGFSLWQHETGVNKVNLSQVDPIPSHFTTADLSLLTQDEALDKDLGVTVIEPDFVQSGDLTVQVTGRANARAPEIPDDAKTFVENTGTLTASQQIVRLKVQRRELRFKFSSNTQDGDYQLGQSIAHVEPRDGRETS